MIGELELGAAAAALIRAEIARAKGNEVCFAARLSDVGQIEDPRVVARGHAHAVLPAVRGLEAGTLVLHNHPSGDVTPSAADLEVAAQLYHDGLGLAIVDNAATELYVVVAPVRATGYEPLDAAAMEQLLAPGGPISRAHPAYEDRAGQRGMTAAVVAAYNGGGVALAEAGTGIGKSIAYLVPAVHWSARNRERTVVSTSTINLQEQLVGKDLPFLRRALGQPFRFALVKGRQNYVSIRRARLAQDGAALLFDEGQQAEMRAVMEWLESTQDGSLQDLAFAVSPEVWDEVESHPDVCLRARCPSFERCFYQRARRDAATADVLVVNHHLLFSDLAVRRASDNYSASAVLPPYTRVVLDEAHNIEDAATSHLGVRVSRRGIARLLARLERRGKGLLPALEGQLRARRPDLIRASALQQIAEELRPRAERTRLAAAGFFDQLERLADAADDGVVRLHDDFTGDRAWIEGPAPYFDNLLLLIEEMPRALRRLREGLQADEKLAERMSERMLELQAIQIRFGDMAAALRTAFCPGTETVPSVRWIERRGGAGREPNVTASAAPIELGPLLRESLFERVHTALLTSATLTTRGSFAFLRGRLGLTAGTRLAEAEFPSPFDFTAQTLLAVPTDVPYAREESGGAFDRMTAAVVEDAARCSDGGLFVLFTSYRALRAVAVELRRRNTHARWPVLVQGEAPRAALLAAFAAAGRAILLGVASFWEGVDVPGRPLRGLVIPKLPFKVPTEPLTAARIEAIEQNGGNSFREYMLPHAALRLKQGFGRLVRTTSDRGAVILLDRRLIEKSYGHYLLDSLPPAPLHTGSWAELLPVVRRFYDETVTAPKDLRPVSAESIVAVDA